MSQSSFIAAMMLAGFLLFIAVEGRLGVYLGILTGKTTGSGGSATPTPDGNNGFTDLPGVLQIPPPGTVYEPGQSMPDLTFVP